MNLLQSVFVASLDFVLIRLHLVGCWPHASTRNPCLMANDCAGTRWLSGVTHMVLNKAQKGLKCTKMALDVLAKELKNKGCCGVLPGVA